MSAPTFVLAGDDAAMQRDLSAELVALVPGARVVRVDAEAAVEAIQRTRPDLVLLELAPALALARALGRDPLAAAIPVVALTADMSPDTLVEAEAAGVAAFVRTPADRRRLGLAVESILGGLLEMTGQEEVAP